MATLCPTGLNASELREQIVRTDERVALTPAGAFHFHRGSDYAVTYLGYDADELAALPGIATARFAGVGNPLRIGPLQLGETVLDHACGSGTDLLLAAQRIGPGGRAIGIDMTAAMRACAHAAATSMGLNQVEILDGLMEALPLPDASVDVVISNGVVNLAPNKLSVFSEIFRVLRPGGRVYLADVIIARELAIEARETPELWAACIAGAMVEHELSEVAASAGFVDGGITATFECFRNTSEARKLMSLRIRGANFGARKPPG
jgi:arsenite methyltransferase